MSLKNTKKELVGSAVSLALCGALFVGGTLAYFTKTVESKGNIITTKKLDVKLNDGSEAALFDSDDVFNPLSPVEKTITIDNTGELDFKYQVKLEANDKTERNPALEEAIQVYVDGSETSVGSLKECLDGKVIISSEEVITPESENPTHKIKLAMPHKEGGYSADLSEQSVGPFDIKVIANEKVTENN